MKNEAPIAAPSHQNPLQRWLARKATPKYYHCIDCGDEFREKHLYDSHIVTHQILDVCYQIQETDDMRFEDPSLQSAFEEKEELWEEENLDKENISPQWTDHNPQILSAAPSTYSRSTPESNVSSDLREGSAQPQLIAYASDSDRLCSVCLEKTGQGGIVDHLLERHSGRVYGIRATKAGSTVTTIKSSIMCEFCPQEAFPAEHDYFLHIWKVHIRDGDELKHVRRPYKMILDVDIPEGTVGVVMDFDEILPAGSYCVIHVDYE